LRRDTTLTNRGPRQRDRGTWVTDGLHHKQAQVELEGKKTIGWWVVHLGGGQLVAKLLVVNCAAALPSEGRSPSTGGALSTHILRKNIFSPEKDQWRQARARAWVSGTN
jgi:hypothetical protein